MSESKTKAMPRMARGRRNRFFKAEGMDDLLSMVLELTAEVSVMRERQYALERVLEQHDIPAGAAVEAWAPTDQDEAHLAEDKDRLITTVLRTLDASSKHYGRDASEDVEEPGATRAA